MKKKLISRKFLAALIPLLVTLFIAASCNSPKKESNTMFDMAEAKKGIEQQNIIFTDAMNKSDSVAVANCYTTDAKFMPPNAKASVGRNSILHAFSGFMKSGMPKFSLKTLEVWGNNDLLVSEDEWTFTDNGGKILDKGKTLILWKMEDGKWKMHRDCYNSDMPLPKAQ